MNKRAIGVALANDSIPDVADMASAASPEQAIVSNFLDLLKKKEEKIERLEAENEQLKIEVARLSERLDERLNNM